jgi:hypothetical protein
MPPSPWGSENHGDKNETLRKSSSAPLQEQKKKKFTCIYNDLSAMEAFSLLIPLDLLLFFQLSKPVINSIDQTFNVVGWVQGQKECEKLAISALSIQESSVRFHGWLQSMKTGIRSNKL